ncbi:TRAP transporter small permease [Hoeflea prorocentri]|uniref:TRAP transporter small permease protein n=1 Tax=Hoeflea prorocentri TaxID=1922333 RepID=A0A9X3ZFQ4_9HYPH|nr:TRAP transporter small permease [Hoeflea prorocentri]MCY6379947.1 TRAP transporter small permease [Hoeflea prorocentri]MDA5397747.1 TRAP transporter small permease [Hoeflea prorocentri]
MDRLLRYLRVFNKGIAGTALVASGTLVAIITIVVAAGVFWRYVLNDSLSWTEELARYLLIWLAAVGSIVAMHRRQHIAIDILPDMVTGLGGRAIRLLIALVIILTCAVMTYFGWILAWNAWGQTASSFYLPLFYTTAAIPVATTGFLLMAIEQALDVICGEELHSGEAV